MGRTEQFDDETVGLTEDGVRDMARRQFGASIAVGFVIALGAAFLALAPAPREVAGTTTHRIASVQAPQMALFNERVASAKRFERELP